jgi:hypothetical protein
MGLFQSKSVQPQSQSQPKILLNYPKVESLTELKLQKAKKEQAERDDRLKHAEIIFDSKKIKHHIEEQLR